MNILLAITLLLTVISLTALVEGLGKKSKAKVNQYMKKCPSGSALASVDNWHDEGKKGVTFTYTCVNVSSSCEEDCVWREECAESGAYVRGIHPIYDKKCKCHKSGYLCCKPQKSLKQGKCKGNSPMPSSKSRSSDSYIASAKTVNNQMTVKMCDLPTPVESLCPQNKTHAQERMGYSKKTNGLLLLDGTLALLIVILAVLGGLVVGLKVAQSRKGRSILFGECPWPKTAWCCGPHNATLCEAACSRLTPGARYIDNYPNCNPGQVGIISRNACCY